MVLKKWQEFIDGLEERRIKKEGGSGTIWITLKEFERVADHFEGQLLSPGGAASALKVSRAMIHQLEQDGRIRAYRIILDQKGWKDEPFYVRLLMSKKGQFIWIPIADLAKYAAEVGKGELPFVKDHIDVSKRVLDFYSKNKKTKSK